MSDHLHLLPEKRRGPLDNENRIVAFVSDGEGTGHFEPYSDFDWSALDALMGETGSDADEVRAGTAKANTETLLLLVFGNRGQILPAQAIGIRALALAHVFGLTDGAKLDDLAGPSGVTRAAVHKIINQFRKKFAAFHLCQRSQAQRAADAARALREHAKRTRKRKGVVPSEVAGAEKEAPDVR